MMDNLTSYGSCPTKRGRRTKVEIDTIKTAIHDMLVEIQPATVRQLFYQLVTKGVIAKTEAEYKTTVCRLLTQMRRDKVIPSGWITDNTRWMRKPRSYSSLEDMLEQQQRFYRRAMWDTQDVYVEIWLEKDALAGVLYEVTAEWDVPLMVPRDIRASPSSNPRPRRSPIRASRRSSTTSGTATRAA